MEHQPQTIVQELLEQGYIVLPGAVPAERLAAAQAAIDHDLATRFDPARQGEYDERSACPDLRDTVVIEDLFLAPKVQAFLPMLFRRPLRWGRPQIAVRWAHGEPRPVHWHLDGVRSAHNGVRVPWLASFTALAGIHLAGESGPAAGNLTVWPGSWRALRDHYRSAGRRALLAGRPPLTFDDGLPLSLQPGDLVVANYLLAHASSANTTATQRRMVFWRGTAPGLGFRRYHRLVHPWADWSV